MSLEKPWETEFNELLVELHSSCGGEVVEIKEKLKDDFRYHDHKVSIYPKFTTNHNQQSVSVTIGETTTGRGEGLDNVEYLIIEVATRSNYEFRIRPEGMFDRMKKKLKLDWEFQTGNKEFDRRFYIEMKSRDSEELFRKAEIQEAIQALDPFALVKVMKGAIICSQTLQNAIQLSLPNVKERMEKVIELAKLVEKG